MKTQPTMTQSKSLLSRLFLLFMFAILSPASVVFAQTTTFTYQGRFTDGGTAANGTYDMQFRLFDLPSVGAGNQIGSTIANGAVIVSNGVFTVPLDFGGAGFSGADRFLEIGVRLAGDGNAYTLLSPRQQLTSAVYAIRAGSATTAETATNATQLNGTDASQYVQANDSRLTDARTPAAGSSNYIQNSVNAQAATFNISGNGTADTLTASNGYFMGSVPMLILDPGNNINPPFLKLAPNVPKVVVGGSLFVGNNLTTVNSVSANQYNLGGVRFMGGVPNGATYVGLNAGTAAPNAIFNAFFGQDTGAATTAAYNSFFGGAAGTANTLGTENSFFGEIAGYKNTTGSANTFLGRQAGRTNTIGNNNTLLGYAADVNANNLSNATAIGANALVTANNSLVLGGIAGLNAAIADTNVGIGTTAPVARLHIAVNGGNVLAGDAGCGSGHVGIGFGSTFTGCTNYSLLGNGDDTFINATQGSSIYFRQANGTKMQVLPTGDVKVTHTLFADQALATTRIYSFGTMGMLTLGSGGSTQLCRNQSNEISTCSSSLRYKTNIQPFISGLSVLNRLRPITFDWKQGGMHDLGFGAEDIAKVEPLLVTRNDKGEVEGVKYDRITAVLVNAVKEQQQQITQQQLEINELKQLIRARHAGAARRRR